MNKNLFFLGFFAATLAACNGDDLGQGSQADTVVLDVRCAADAECPSGFECETETEHGVDTSYCVSDESEGTSTGECPAGYEQEVEHEGTFCEPHGGGDDSGSGGAGGDDSGSGGAGGDDGGSGGASEGQACVTSADCAAGLECEAQVENGVTTSVCKAHGGG